MKAHTLLDIKYTWYTLNYGFGHTVKPCSHVAIHRAISYPATKHHLITKPCVIELIPCYCSLSHYGQAYNPGKQAISPTVLAGSNWPS